MDRPAFTLSGSSQPPPKPQSSSLLEDLERGTFDSLFIGGSHTPSDLFRQARNPPAAPSVSLVKSSPFRPTVYTLPEYPPLARMAKINGQVAFTATVKSDGHAATPNFLSGHPILQKAVAASVSGWTFPTEAAGQEMQVAIEFKMNCPSIQQ
jgi:outer membrane biosynthesis protein TonB